MRPLATMLLTTLALAVAGCSAQSEEEKQQGDTASRLIEVQAEIADAQAGLTKFLSSPTWSGEALRYQAEEVVARDLDEASTKLAGLFKSSGEPERETLSDTRDSLGSLVSVLSALGEVGVALDSLESVSVSSAGSWPLRQEIRRMQRIRRNAPRITRELDSSISQLRSASSSAENLAADAGVDPEEGTDYARLLEAIAEAEEDSELGRLAVQGRLSEEIASAYRALERLKARNRAILASRLPDGACAKVAVGSPSTLGENEVFVYPTGIDCDSASNLAAAAYQDQGFLESGSGTFSSDSPEMPTMTCTLRPPEPLGDARLVFCEAMGQRVVFQAPAGAS